MPKNVHVTDEIKLEGFQAILEPGKFGYSLSAVVDESVIDALETERTALLGWAESKLKNPKRATLKPTPWEEVADGKYKIKFSWGEDRRPGVVDTEGTPVTDKKTPLYGGSTVKLGFFQKPYILRDGVTYGSSLKLLGVQVVAVGEGAAVDTDSMDEADVADMFGKTDGFVATATGRNPETETINEQEEEDF
jgi:ABC-type Fe3+ transport system substrate-binding protein